MAQKADVVIYAISTNFSRDRHRRRQGSEVLRGRDRRPGIFPVQGAGSVAGSFENIANELRHQYNVLYRPEPLKADGLCHTIDVEGERS